MTLFNKTLSFLPVEGVPKVGEKYHVSWGAHPGVVGLCVQVYRHSKEVKLIRPRTKVPFAKLIPWSELRHTRYHQNLIEQGHKPY